MLAAYAIAFGLLLYVAYRLQRFAMFVKSLRHLPGPSASLFSFGNAVDIPFDRIEFMRKLQEWAMKFSHDGIFRIWLGPNPIVIVCGSSTAEAVLSSTSATVTEKSNNYDILLPWLKRGLLTSYGPKWKIRRRLLTPTFHFDILNSFLPIFNRQARTLCEILEANANHGISFDMYPFVGRCALDIICETAMGVKVDAQRVRKSKYIDAVKELGEIVIRHERSPWLWFKPLLHLLGYQKNYDKNLNIVHGFTRKVIEDRMHEYSRSKATPAASTDEFGATKRRQAFLDLLIEGNTDNSLNVNDIQEEVDTFMFEGHDTTASGMSWTLYLLGLHPSIQETLYQEIIAVKPIDDDSDFSSEEIKSLKYLEAVVKEGLRLFPPVPFFGRRVHEDFKTGPWTIPKGSTILTIPFLIHRNEDAYGPEYNNFSPERMLSQDKAQNPYAYVPFSAGPRNCIGQKFAMTEEKVVIASLVRRYKINSLNSRIIPVPDIVLRPPYSMLVRLEKRGPLA